MHTPLRDGRADWPPKTFGNDVAQLGAVRARIVGLEALKADKAPMHADPLAAAKDRAGSATLASLPQA